MNSLAPIALFAFKRPEHVRRAIESLGRNPEFHRSPLIIFCDGPRDERDAAGVEAARSVVRTVSHPVRTVYESAKNKGLANSIVAGVTDLCARFGRVIVVEDDLIVGESFLRYMNDALDRYATATRVMQISGHMFPVNVEPEADAIFLPFVTSWGWATWSRAWKHYSPDTAGWTQLRDDARLRSRFDLEGSYPYFSMLRRQVKGEIDSWAIRWYWSCFKLGGITLYPCESLVQNDGFDGQGTHCNASSPTVSREPPVSRIIRRFPEPEVDLEAFSRVRSHLKAQNRPIARAMRRLRRTFI